MTTSTYSASMGNCLVLRPGTDVGPVPFGKTRQDRDGTRQRTLGGQVPDQASCPGRAGVEGSGPTSPNQRHQASQYSGHVRRLAASHNYVAH
jgi:hypothetical protein